MNHSESTHNGKKYLQRIIEKSKWFPGSREMGISKVLGHKHEHLSSVPRACVKSWTWPQALVRDSIREGDREDPSGSLTSQLGWMSEFYNDPVRGPVLKSKVEVWPLAETCMCTRHAWTFTNAYMHTHKLKGSLP